MSNFPQPFYKWRPHPWHGLAVGQNPPENVHAFIELTTFDSVKFEVDKATGYLRVDRPAKTSSQPPALYGFIPRTYCGPRVHALSPKSSRGDADPLDICVISERPINRAEILLNAIVVGGLQMVDGGEADDKIIAVLENDHMWGDIREISELPSILVERLRHYFLTYKDIDPSAPSHQIVINETFGAEHARKVISAATLDYNEEFGAD
jgi:inorganic pyrophosphatase